MSVVLTRAGKRRTREQNWTRVAHPPERPARGWDVRNLDLLTLADALHDRAVRSR